MIDADAERIGGVGFRHRQPTAGASLSRLLSPNLPTSDQLRDPLGYLLGQQLEQLGRDGQVQAAVRSMAGQSGLLGVIHSG